ncbi:PLD nuclease N-terminal domain-containing protein [Actinoplanes sp. NPDC049118]|uniref:PLD nuclease N-terminal domain-containing protein n=1 Tax=Actinoplanes sp. NPDC049118 TaxID=3155769 RepID=UPI0033C8685B
MTFGDFLWSLLIFYFIFFYFLILFRILSDLFGDRDTSGWMKTVWILALLFLPFLTMIIYLIARGKSMAERTIARHEAAAKDQQEYIRRVAASSGGGSDPTAQIAKGHELLQSGAITQQEFDSIKAKALA